MSFLAVGGELCMQFLEQTCSNRAHHFYLYIFSWSSKIIKNHFTVSQCIYGKAMNLRLDD